MPVIEQSDRNPSDFSGSSQTQFLPSDLTPGSAVHVRGREWRLMSIVRFEDCAQLQLVSIRPETRLSLLWPFDRPRPRARELGLRVVRPRRWLAWLAMQSVEPRYDSLRCEPPSRIQFRGYQIAPALAVLAGHSRVMLADEVGLGKTVQAAWIVAETLARRSDSRVLIAVPAGLRRQWSWELEQHFGISTIDADAAWSRRSAADLPPEVNPWSLAGVFVASVDFLKRPEVVRAVEGLFWDLLIVDEVHTCAAPTDRYRALHPLACHAQVVVAITATPFAGDERAFASISALGAKPSEPPPMTFRRSRRDLEPTAGRRHRFAAIPPTSDEWRLQRLLERYTRLVWRESDDVDERAKLAMIVLRKRALSSATSACLSLERRRAWLGRRPGTAVQISLFDDDTLEDAEPLEVLGARGLSDERRELRWLRALVQAAHAARANESKIRYLRRLLARVRGESAIVFTEYRDTLERLAVEVGSPLILHGGLSIEERDRVQRRFNDQGGTLLATDAASQGLNLHGRCRLVINYELPWNPARLEQRIGRVDRFGQTRSVHAVTMVARDSAEDLVLSNLSRRLARVARRLGAHDRLAAFLSEARLARTIIGGAALDLSTCEDKADEPIAPVPADLTTRADAEADRLRTRRALSNRPRKTITRRHLGSSPEIVPVTCLSASRTLKQGFILLVRATVTSFEGERIDSASVAVHVPIETRRPASAAEVRQIAQAAMLRWQPAIQHAAAGALRERRAEVETFWRLTTGRIAERLGSLASTSSRERAMQTGLFDPRDLPGFDPHVLPAADWNRERLIRLSETQRLHDITTVVEVTGIAAIAGPESSRS